MLFDVITVLFLFWAFGQLYRVARQTRRCAPLRFEVGCALAPITLRCENSCGPGPGTVSSSHARCQRIFWQSLDQLMPDGPPVFLMAVVLLLLNVNGTIALSR
jgi:hypothetical protein